MTTKPATPVTPASFSAASALLSLSPHDGAALALLALLDGAEPPTPEALLSALAPASLACQTLITFLPTLLADPTIPAPAIESRLATLRRARRDLHRAEMMAGGGADPGE